MAFNLKVTRLVSCECSARSGDGVSTWHWCGWRRIFDGIWVDTTMSGWFYTKRKRGDLKTWKSEQLKIAFASWWGSKKGPSLFRVGWRAIEIWVALDQQIKGIDRVIHVRSQDSHPTKTVSRNSRMKLEEMERHGALWVGTERLKFEESRQVAAPTQCSARKFEESLGRTNWATLMMSDVRYFLDPLLLLKSKGAWPMCLFFLLRSCMCTTQKSLQGWRKGSTRFAGPQKGNNPTSLKQKKQTSESPDRKLQGSSAIYSSLVTIFDCTTFFSSYHERCHWLVFPTYVRTWWMPPSPWVPRMSSYLQLCNCWNIGNALMLRFVVWCCGRGWYFQVVFVIFNNPIPRCWPSVSFTGSSILKKKTV